MHLVAQIIGGGVLPRWVREYYIQAGKEWTVDRAGKRKYGEITVGIVVVMSLL